MRFTLAALLMLSATPVLAADIGCEGIFSTSTTLADLEAAFGKENVVTGEVPGAEGTPMIATTLFPGDADREAQVRWWDEEEMQFVAGVTLARGDTGPLGVRAGMPIAEVEAINGEPFPLLGFYWDYGGGAGFQSGKLGALPGGCFLNIGFTPTNDDLPQDIVDAISGDMELMSNQPEVQQAGVVVESINLYFDPPPEIEALWNEDGGAEGEG